MIRPFQGTFITFNSIVFSFNLIEALIFHPPQDPHHHQTKQGGDPSGCDGGVAEGSSLFRWPPGYHHLAAPPTKAQMHAVYTRASESQNIRIASHGLGPTTAQMQI